MLENLSDQVGSTRALVFGALTEMLKQESLISSFHGFCELIILKVLEAHRDEEKDVSLIISTVFPYSRQIDHFWPICKRSSLRSQCCEVRLFLRFSNTLFAWFIYRPFSG